MTDRITVSLNERAAAKLETLCGRNNVSRSVLVAILLEQHADDEDLSLDKAVLSAVASKASSGTPPILASDESPAPCAPVESDNGEESGSDFKGPLPAPSDPGPPPPSGSTWVHDTFVKPHNERPQPPLTRTFNPVPKIGQTKPDKRPKR